MLREPLLEGQAITDVFPVLALPICMFCSACGMILLKMATVQHWIGPMITGYMCEAIAFGVYPFALKAYSMRVVSTMWSSSSVLTGLLCGYLFYSEIPSLWSLIGCCVMLAGVFLVHL